MAGCRCRSWKRRPPRTRDAGTPDRRPNIVAVVAGRPCPHGGARPGAGGSRVAPGRSAAAQGTWLTAVPWGRYRPAGGTRPRDTGVTRRPAAEADLPRLGIVTGDAFLTSQYADLAPAGLVLACGLSGNMTDAGVEQTIANDRLLHPTARDRRHRRVDPSPPGSGPRCRGYARCEERGLERVWLSDPGYRQCRGPVPWRASLHRHAPLERDAVMFTFTDHGIRRGPRRAT
jgi:hypothetical protein